jgi:hypothetical protein
MLRATSALHPGSDKEEQSMAKVLGMHTIELKPGCDPKEFEEFMMTEALPTYGKVPGQTGRLLKGDRGERAGKYLLIVELESPERRDHIYPSEGGVAEDVQQLMGDIQPLLDKVYSFVEYFPDPNSTDYVMVSD